MEYTVYYSVNGINEEVTFLMRYSAYQFITENRKASDTFFVHGIVATKIVRTVISITEEQLAENVNPFTWFEA